jgi:hypothetical protein
LFLPKLNNFAIQNAVDRVNELVLARAFLNFKLFQAFKDIGLFIIKQWVGEVRK